MNLLYCHHSGCQTNLPPNSQRNETAQQSSGQTFQVLALHFCVHSEFYRALLCLLFQANVHLCRGISCFITCDTDQEPVGSQLLP